jgi:hypothetical protein
MTDSEFEQLEAVLHLLDDALRTIRTPADADACARAMDLIDRELARMKSELCERLQDIEPWGNA